MENTFAPYKRPIQVAMIAPTLAFGIRLIAHFLGATSHVAVIVAAGLMFILFMAGLLAAFVAVFLTFSLGRRGPLLIATLGVVANGVFLCAQTIIFLNFLSSLER